LLRRFHASTPFPRVRPVVALYTPNAIFGHRYRACMRAPAHVVVGRAQSTSCLSSLGSVHVPHSYPLPDRPISSPFATDRKHTIRPDGQKFCVRRLASATSLCGRRVRRWRAHMCVVGSGRRSASAKLLSRSGHCFNAMLPK
jgi:hypothetical protein